MLRFHVAVHGRPESVRQQASVRLADVEVPTLSWDQQRQPDLPISFESACDVLRQLPLLFLDPDGAFWWNGVAGEREWEVGGGLFDRGPSLAYCELKGECPAPDFLRLISCLAQPESLMIQIVQYGVYVEVADFLQWAGSDLHGRPGQ